MKKLLSYAALLLLTLMITPVSHAQPQIQLDASALNGAELGAGYQVSDNFGFGANYGYLRYADAANLQIRGGLKHFYAFGTINLINANARGRQAIADAVNKIVTDQANKDAESQRALSGLSFSQGDFKMHDLGAGGGLGMKFGAFFLELGVRTTQIRSDANQEVDMFINKMEEHVQNNQNLTVVEKQDMQTQLETARNDAKNGLNQTYQQIPGKLMFAPDFRIGFRITIGK